MTPQQQLHTTPQKEPIEGQGSDSGGATRAAGNGWRVAGGGKQQGEAGRRRRWLGRSLQPAVKFSLVYVALSARQCQNRHTSATLPRSLFLLVVRPSAFDSLSTDLRE
ncbi:hypothetical protein E2C01_085738 [Portunus trituberculatus]|uniref:Uncharacterized protein n=1 Tax=Portunus trituberculatus TaxID=210409 RepID=A0A5B7J1T6_PORTR|nr:hypothetical protein [Portunus trituberculatus]